VSHAARARIVFALVSLAVAAIDQVSKAIVLRHLAPAGSVPIVPGLFNLTFVTNRGALFGLLHDLPDPFRAVLFTVVPGLAVALVVLFQYRTDVTERLTQTGLALILGGAIGNLADRIRLGHVVDFLDVFVGTHHWPAFNAADSSICIGVGLLLLDLIARSRRAAPPASPES
jgi:signal peptidase II